MFPSRPPGLPKLQLSKGLPKAPIESRHLASHIEAADGASLATFPEYQPRLDQTPLSKGPAQEPLPSQPQQPQALSAPRAVSQGPAEDEAGSPTPEEAPKGETPAAGWIQPPDLFYPPLITTAVGTTSEEGGLAFTGPPGGTCHHMMGPSEGICGAARDPHERGYCRMRTFPVGRCCAFRGPCAHYFVYGSPAAGLPTAPSGLLYSLAAAPQPQQMPGSPACFSMYPLPPSPSQHAAQQPSSPTTLNAHLYMSPAAGEDEEEELDYSFSERDLGKDTAPTAVGPKLQCFSPNLKDLKTRTSTWKWRPKSNKQT